MSDDKKVQVLPFHAVNEFMREDYRLIVLHEVFSTLDQCTPIQKQLILRMFSKNVTVPGFRNSGLAPLSIKIKNSPSLFERSHEFSATVMQCWSNLHPELKSAMYTLLIERGWTLQPLEADHSLLPGFQIDWPKADNFESLIKAIQEAHPEMTESDDNISLMAVWVGNKLPYNLYSEDANTES
jgi:hypothetical protein